MMERLKWGEKNGTAHDLKHTTCQTRWWFCYDLGMWWLMISLLTEATGWIQRYVIAFCVLRFSQMHQDSLDDISSIQPRQPKSFSWWRGGKSLTRQRDPMTIKSWRWQHWRPGEHHWGRFKSICWCQWVKVFILTENLFPQYVKCDDFVWFDVYLSSYYWNPKLWAQCFKQATSPTQFFLYWSNPTQTKAQTLCYFKLKTCRYIKLSIVPKQLPNLSQRLSV